MNNKKIILVLSLFVLSLTQVIAQKVVSISGDIKALKGESKLKVEYDFSKLMVGNYSDEQAYITKKREDITKKDGAAKADEWEKGWKASRETRYQPKFQELFNDQAKDIPLMISPDNKDAKYTLILKTTFIEPGFNVGVMKKPSFINVEYIFVETANPSNVVAKFSANNIPGSQVMGYDFDAGSRIAESYAKAGKMMGGYIKKNIAK
ncbi:MAG TPA: hypothetical protein VK750_07875 [Cytophagaceae bacterium]|jgi:hypothetical protein|nr:hypothetical protein [Cytophagaceae bacterium]